MSEGNNLEGGYITETLSFRGFNQSHMGPLVPEVRQNVMVTGRGQG